MSYLQFEKSELVNLEYSLPREILSTNHSGGYLNTTLVGCNTRRYHGLFVLPLVRYDNRRHVLLSALDETLSGRGKQFNLGIRCYGRNHYDPRGHKYIIDCEQDRLPSLTYRVGDMIFRKTLLFLQNKEQLLIRYDLLEGEDEILLQLKPFLNFREIHSLTRANDRADRGYVPIENGAAFRMYDGFPALNIQLNRSCDYVHHPDWYYGVVYQDELRRGFEYKEDLYCPGHFELTLRKGKPVIVSVSTLPVATHGLSRVYAAAEMKKPSRNSYEQCLKTAARQFVVDTPGRGKEIYSGYSWLGKTLRDTLIALPGLTLSNDGNAEAFEEILKNTCRIYEPQLMNGSRQADAALWLFWAVQQYAGFRKDRTGVWKRFSAELYAVGHSFLSGKRMGIRLDENGLLWSKMKGVAMSWMDAYDGDGNPITERGGYKVELNALWYNAVSMLAEMTAVEGTEKRELYLWKDLQEKIERNFHDLFWEESRSHLADYIGEGIRDISTRPNQIFACALEYSPLTEETRAKVMQAVRKELLTTRGLRTLSPKNPLYKGVYDGNQDQRDHAYHQGSTRVWLIPFYIEAMLKLYGDSFVPRADQLVNAFEEDITVHGIGSVCELYDGDPPHFPHGAISSAIATAGLLRAIQLIRNYKGGGK